MSYVDRVVLRHRPGLHRHHLRPHREVLPYEDGAVNRVVPHGRVVCAIHNVYLDFHGSGEGRVAFVLGGGLQLVGLALENAREQYTNITNQVDDSEQLAPRRILAVETPPGPEETSPSTRWISYGRKCTWRAAKAPKRCPAGFGRGRGDAGARRAYKKHGSVDLGLVVWSSNGRTAVPSCPPSRPPTREPRDRGRRRRLDDTNLAFTEVTTVPTVTFSLM